MNHPARGAIGLALLTLATACEGASWRDAHPNRAAASDTGLLRGPYLQMGTPTSAIIRWRTLTATNSRVRLGTALADLETTVDLWPPTTEHEVQVVGLSPATRYYYTVGTTTMDVAGPAADQFFVTPPVPGTPRPLRLWAIGDSGTADENAARVRDAYREMTGGMNVYTDVWLLLGDNAYPSGADESHQRAIFDMYPMFLRQSFVWPTIGNHDVGEDPTLPAERTPYLDIFTLPSRGEAGGVPSGTERYYAFDFADVHFICLDSMTSDRKPGSPMMMWLEADLAATTRQWIIAFWHHPPYSKGNHDSDYQIEMVEMRQWALPILERYGVDLVLSGHSHTWERSFLLDGHYGLSTSFLPEMKKDPGTGRAAEGAAYHKSTAGKAGHEGAVYVVAGNAGHVNAAGPHPAVFLSLDRLGSLVVDVNGGRLEARLLRDNRFLDDAFTLLKGPQANALPMVQVTSPPNEATATTARPSLSASASDPDGRIVQVEFFMDTFTPIGSDQTPPYEVEWTAVDGVHQLLAVATDDQGAAVTSMPVTITVPDGVGVKAPAVPDAGERDAATDAPPEPLPDASAIDRAAAVDGAPVDGAAPIRDAAVDATTDASLGGWRLRPHPPGESPGWACAMVDHAGVAPAWLIALLLGALAQRARRGHRGRRTRNADRRLRPAGPGIMPIWDA